VTYRDMENAVLEADLPRRLHQHRQRLWRVAINVRDHARAHADDERLLHLLSRVGIFVRGLSDDMKAEAISSEEATELLDLLADLGEMSFEHWLADTDDDLPDQAGKT
jgi:hypothetical protein